MDLEFPSIAAKLIQLLSGAIAPVPHVTEFRPKGNLQKMDSLMRMFAIMMVFTRSCPCQL